MVDKGNGWLRFAAKLSAWSGQDNSTSFTLPNHTDANLTADQSAQEICTYFSSISQEYIPLDLTTLPERVKVKLDSLDCSHPVVHDHEVYKT